MNAEPTICTNRKTLRIALPGIVAGLVLRLSLLVYLCICTHACVPQLARGHDGGEYLDFAGAIAHLDLSLVPPDARRHDPGWPILLAPVVRLLGPGWAAFLVNLSLFALSAIVLTRLLIEFVGFPPARVKLLTIAYACAYPPQLYYSAYAMSEPAFLYFTISALYWFRRQKRPVAYVLAGCAGLIRGPGLLLIVAFAAADMLAKERCRKVLWAFVALIPEAVWQCFSYAAWHSNAAGIHKPKFGFPIAGYVELMHAAPIKFLFVIAAMLAAIATCWNLGMMACKHGWRDRLSSSAAIYCLLFLLFHLFLYSLDYLGTRVYTPRYMDRYLIALVPFALIAFCRMIGSNLIVAAGICSLALSAYWGTNYAKAAAYTTGIKPQRSKPASS